jgi:peptide/nickel transport system permease protein
MPKQGSLFAYTISRLILALPTLLILLTVLFLVLRILPGDPISALEAGRRSTRDIASDKARLGLDQPWWIQYPVYLSQVFSGNFGNSLGQIYLGQPVLQVIVQKLPATIELAIGAMLVATVMGVGTGVIAGARRDKAPDVIVRLYGSIIWVIPVFWLGLMLQLVFAVGLHWFPPNLRYEPDPVFFPPPTHITGLFTLDSLLEGRLDKFAISVAHLALPSLTLGLVLSGFFTRTVRANLLRTIGSDYVEAARARGIRERHVIYRYALRNALIPVVTILGLQFAILFAGAVLTERTFSWDGMGTLLLTSIDSRDYPMIQGTVIVYAIIIVAISVIIDVINGLIDPRVRY